MDDHDYCTRALPTRTGKGRIFFDGAVHDCSWRPEAAYADYETVVSLDDGRSIVVSDGYDDLGFGYRAPDSGTLMTDMFVLLAEGEPDPVGVPTAEELRAEAFDGLRPLFDSVTRGETDAEDLDFARQLFGEPACLLRTIQREGSADAARKAILRDVFRLTGV